MSFVRKIYMLIRCIKDYLVYSKQNLEYKRKYWNRQAVILLGEPEYNNLGDHAIAYATKCFVEERFPNIEFFSITEAELRYNFKNVSRIIKEEDVLLLQGGGNMGDMYLDQVKLRRKIIRRFKNEIIVMPQTIYFKNGNERLPKYYHENKERITLVARETVSYDIMRRLYSGETILSPDIVLYLNGKLKEKSLKYNCDVMICMRNDVEKAKNATSCEEIVFALNELRINYKLFSTVVNHNVYNHEREQYLYDLFQNFFESKMIITDRLHAMIIAAITRTPCLVIPTMNHKVIKSYSWVEEFNYIELLQRPEDLIYKIERLLHLGDNKCDKDISNNFIPLFTVISKKIERARM